MIFITLEVNRHLRGRHCDSRFSLKTCNAPFLHLIIISISHDSSFKCFLRYRFDYNTFGVKYAPHQIPAIHLMHIRTSVLM